MYFRKNYEELKVYVFLYSVRSRVVKREVEKENGIEVVRREKF